MRPKGPKQIFLEIARPYLKVLMTPIPPPPPPSYLKVWIRHWYVTLYLRDCHDAASLLFWNRAEITVLVCEQKPDPVWFSRLRSWDIRYSENIAVNSLKAHFHCRLIFTCVNKIDAMAGLSRVSVTVERGSAFTLQGAFHTFPLFHLRS